MTKSVLKQLHDDVRGLKSYILALKDRELNGIKCENCGKKDNELHIHHKRIAIDTTYYDLELLCYNCHKKLHSKGIFKLRSVILV